MIKPAEKQTQVPVKDRVDVQLEAAEAVVSLSRWTEGIGWSTQKTMRLDVEQLEDLHRLITAARCRLREDQDDPQDKGLDNVIRFPAA